MSVLAVRSVSKKLGTHQVLDKFDLRLEDGERVALLGPSGCGKTTVLRLLAGLEIPDAGQIILGDEIVAADGRLRLPPESRNVGLVFQDLALWPHLTVWGNLEFVLESLHIAKPERDQRIREILDRVELATLARAKPATLSGGQQQRVALARALVQRPRALLMDEPLSSLDYDLNLRLRREILDLQSALRFALLYVTHDREEAFQLAQRVVLMGHGRVIAEGTLDEIREYLAGNSTLG